MAIVVAEFNEPLTAQLLDGARAALAEHTGGSGEAAVFWVPGAFEIPQTVAALIRAGQHDGILSLGCLIQGDTDHYAVLAAEVTRRLGALSVESSVPICFGVLTCRTVEQAAERADPARENKGGEVMTALLRMISLSRMLGQASRAEREGRRLPG